MRPLDLYNGAIKFVQASARLHPDRLEQIAKAQAERVVQELGNIDFDHDQATELIVKLASDDPCDPFSEEQKKTLAMCSTRFSTMTVGQPHPLAVSLTQSNRTWRYSTTCHR